MVAGYAVGGGHILHMVCDLTIAADNAVFGQTGPKARCFIDWKHMPCMWWWAKGFRIWTCGGGGSDVVPCSRSLLCSANKTRLAPMQTWMQVGSFDAGYGSTQMARIVGQKKAREMWFLARLYDAKQVRVA